MESFVFLNKCLSYKYNIQQENPLTLHNSQCRKKGENFPVGIFVSKVATMMQRPLCFVTTCVYSMFECLISFHAALVLTGICLTKGKVPTEAAVKLAFIF